MDKYYLSYLLTPWDSRALSVKTAEFKIHPESETFHDSTHYVHNWEQLSTKLENKNVQLSYGRIGSQYKKVISDAQTNGYRITEVSHTVSINKLQMWQAPAAFSKTFALDIASQNDLPAIQEIAVKNFKYGRFAEDPSITEEKNKTRQRLWINDLIKQETIFIKKIQNSTIGFMAISRPSNIGQVDLILGGVRDTYPVMVYRFWVSIIEQLKREGVKSVKTLVSASNIGVINLYARLGFLFAGCDFGFRKWHK